MTRTHRQEIVVNVIELMLKTLCILSTDEVGLIQRRAQVELHARKVIFKAELLIKLPPWFIVG